jgi:condensin complex subunit 3
MTRQVSYHSIVLAVKRKELVLREKGLVCLGLCCLIARRMALNLF